MDIEALEDDEIDVTAEVFADFLKGEQGPQGIQGEPGIQGLPGRDGANGQDRSRWFRWIYTTKGS